MLNNCFRFILCVVLFLSLLLHFLNIGTDNKAHYFGWFWCSLVFLLCFISIYKMPREVKFVFYIFSMVSIAVGWIFGATDSLWGFFIYPIVLALWYIVKKRRKK